MGDFCSSSRNIRQPIIYLTSWRRRKESVLHERAKHDPPSLSLYPIMCRLSFIIWWFVLSIPVKYDYIGKLLKPGDEPTEYTDEEEEEEGKDKKED